MATIDVTASTAGFHPESRRRFLCVVTDVAPMLTAALIVRIFLLIASHLAQKKWHVDLQVIGQEAGFVAWSLASGKGFSNPFPHYEAATAWLAPVFPALWAVGLKIFDPQTSEKGVYFAQILNCIFSSLTCLPVFWLGRQVFGDRVARIAAWCWAFWPLAILFSLEWAWDQSLSALVLTTLVCATYKLKDAAGSSMAWSLYGLGWGFAALVNPTMCLLFPFLLFWVAFVRGSADAPGAKLILRPVLRPVLRTVALFVLAIAPWTARNYFALDGLTFIKSNFGLELWLSNNPDVPPDDVYAPKLHPMNNPRQLFQLAFAGELPYMRAKQRAAISFIRSNPAMFARLAGKRILDTWTAWYDSRIDKWIRVLHLSRVTVVFCSAVSLLSLVGSLLALRQRFLDALPLTLSAVLFAIPYYVTHTTLRYRHPIDPLLMLFAVYAVVQVARLASAGRLRVPSENP